MGRTNKYKAPLNDYAKDASKILSKSESVTSHLLLSYLFYIEDIYPWNIVPQPNSKRGIIDFFYLPKDRSYNTFIEMKKFRSLDSNMSDNASKYLKMKFPSALKGFGRSDNVRLLIVTDLRSINISVRQKQRGSTSAGYSIPLIQAGSVADCASIITDWLKRSAGEACRIVIWENQLNRWVAVKRELSKGKSSNLYKMVYAKWLSKLGSRGGRKWPSKFLKAYKARCNMINKHVEPDHINAITSVFDESKIKEIVGKSFVQLGVTFRQGPTPSLFSRT